MRIAVASLDRFIHSPVAPCLGRAAWLIVVESATNRWEAIPLRSGPPEPDQAGIRAARSLIRADAHAAVAGWFGDSAARMLHAAHVCLVLGPALKVNEAVTAFRNGQLMDF